MTAPAPTVSIVNLAVLNNAWFLQSFRFGTTGDLSWSFAHQEFLCDWKLDPTSALPDLALSSVAVPATIVVDDPIARILHFEVNDEVFDSMTAAPDPGIPYNYDLLMVDLTTGVRIALMRGLIYLVQGITIEDS